MRTPLRRVFILTVLGFATAALAAGAGLAKPGNHPSHPATAAGGSNDHGSAAAPGQAASTPAAASDGGSAPAATSTPATAPDTTAPAATASAGRDDRGSSMAAAPSSGVAAQWAQGPSGSSAWSSTAGPGAASGGSGHGPGSGLRDTSHFLSSLNRRMERLAMRGRTARSGVLSQTASCGYGPSSQEFLPWGDPASYYLAPQGDIASTSNWSLSHVTVAAGHDSFSGSTGSIVLASDNASAETPVACVNLQNPTMRFFLTHSGPRSASALDVYVVYEGLDGHPHTLTLASLAASDSWQPSLVIPIGVNALSTASVNGWTPVSFGFAVHGLKPGESYSIDGVYVDPIWSR